MVNHVRTLLLNESASRAGDSAGWFIDPSYDKVVPPAHAVAILGIIFDGVSSVEDKAKIVDALMPFALSPEFSSYLESFDTRTTVSSDSRPVRYETVFSFYESKSDLQMGFVGEVLSSQHSPLLFQHTGDEYTDRALDSLYEIFAHSVETSKKFSALLVALVFVLDRSYRMSLAS